MTFPLKILVIEDSPADFLLLARYLRHHGLDVTIQRVDTNSALQAALEQEWDVILSDYSIPGMSFRVSLDWIRQRSPDMPVILVSGSVGEETAIELLRLGLADFILKDHLPRLPAAIKRAIEEADGRRARAGAEAALRESMQRYRTLLDNLPQIVWQKDRNSVYVSSNAAYARALDITQEALPGKTDYDFYPAHLAEKYRHDDQEIMARGNIEILDEQWLTQGEPRFLHTTKVPLHDDQGVVYGTLGIAEDITDKKRAESALFASEVNYRSLFENMINGYAQCLMLFEDGAGRLHLPERQQIV